MPAPSTLAEINERIAAIRENLRDLTEQAAARSGAADEDLADERIATQEAQLASLIKLREAFPESSA
jgi:predicted  nucleic acid-binding Zn-ribbon protein